MLSPVRTSTQCWCDDTHGCIDHPTVQRVTERMTNITRLPVNNAGSLPDGAVPAVVSNTSHIEGPSHTWQVNNAEYFQILKYERGQFYRVHHDQQTAHWTPQGVRVYTFFVYLSDVAAGGGTKFNDLGLTVTPKLGRGILWPSVQVSSCGSCSS